MPLPRYTDQPSVCIGQIYFAFGAAEPDRGLELFDAILTVNDVLKSLGDMVDRPAAVKHIIQVNETADVREEDNHPIPFLVLSGLISMEDTECLEGKERVEIAAHLIVAFSTKPDGTI